MKIAIIFLLIGNFIFFLNAQLDISKFGQLTYDVRQFASLDKNNHTIQWDFVKSDIAQLRSNECFNNVDVQWKIDVSQVKLLFDTTTYLKAWLSELILVGFAVDCGEKGISNTEWFQLAGPGSIDAKAFPYTMVTLYVGKCRKNFRIKDRTITGIEIMFSKDHGKTKLYVGGKAKPKKLSPKPKDNCARISNFKTLYIDSIPVG